MFFISIELVPKTNLVFANELNTTYLLNTFVNLILRLMDFLFYLISQKLRVKNYLDFHLRLDDSFQQMASNNPKSSPLFILLTSISSLLSAQDFKQKYFILPSCHSLQMIFFT